jgi:CheY-like chemotaxis protein
MKKKILIIDDDKLEIAVTSKTLEHLGKFDVVSSTKSSTALELIRKEKPDLLLLDIMMPEVDGLTICKQVKDDPELKHIKVIVYSAKMYEADKKKAFRFGADAYVEKVIQTEKLIETLNKALEE